MPNGRHTSRPYKQHRVKFMWRIFPRSFNQALVAAIPLSLLVGWLTDHWTLCGAAAVCALCILALRNPRIEFLERLPLLRRLASREPAPDTSWKAVVGLAPLPPPRRVVRKERNMPLVRQMIAQGR